MKQPIIVRLLYSLSLEGEKAAIYLHGAARGFVSETLCWDSQYHFSLLREEKWIMPVFFLVQPTMLLQIWFPGCLMGERRHSTVSLCCSPSPFHTRCLLGGRQEYVFHESGLWCNFHWLMAKVVHPHFLCPSLVTVELTICLHVLMLILVGKHPLTWIKQYRTAGCCEFYFDYWNNIKRYSRGNGYFYI